MKQVRTYMSYTFPMDPVRIFTIADMNLSYALASTLVRWDEDKQLNSSVAESWEPTNKRNGYIFKIKKNLKWSNGEPVTASDIKRSFERAFTDCPSDTRSLSQLIERMTIVADDTIEFILSDKTDRSSLLGKLTEPNYGILKITANGKIDLSITTGAFYLEEGHQSELTLRKNPYWLGDNSQIADSIIIRKLPKGADLQTVLFNDPWPNLIETSSLIPKEYMESYKNQNFQIWTRPIDKVFLLQLSKKFANTHGPALLRYLRKVLSRKDLTTNLSGLSVSDQVFPIGYQLHDNNLKESSLSEKIPEYFLKNTLHVLYCPERVSPTLLENLKKTLADAGLTVEYKSTSLDKIGAHRKESDFDIYASPNGLADPSSEGIMSYFFEGDSLIIPQGRENFVEKLDIARQEKDQTKRMAMMRALLSEATLKGHVLPLFHLSTVGIARSNLDLSNIPKSEESVTFSKIRFRGKD